jgi:hypothetical protein
MLVATIGVAGLLVAGCPGLDLDDLDPDTVEVTPDEPSPAPGAEFVREAVEQTVEVLRNAAKELESIAALEAEDARASAGRAAKLLTDAPALVGGLPGDVPGDDPFLPSEEEQPSVLTRSLGTAHQAGDAGSRFIAVLNDPVAGDLTSWQRHPEDRIDQIATAVRAGSEESIGQLEGQVPAAVAWAVLAANARDIAVLRDYGERAAAHLAVALAALDGVGD